MSENITVIRNVPLAELAKDALLPEELLSQVNLLINAGETAVDVMTRLGETDYELILVPPHMEEWADLIEEDDVIDEEEEQAGQRMSLLGRLRSRFGKTVDFQTENEQIARNRKRKAAREPHQYQAAKWATRKGVVRCRVCGSAAPVEGNLCAGITTKDVGEDGVMGDEEYGEDYGEEWNLADLTLRNAALAEAHCEIVEEYGPWQPVDAHYMDASPFVDDGLICANCIAYDAEAGGCEWVCGPINENGICKLHVIPDSMKKAAETFTPPQSVQDEAQRALNWLKDGHAGPGFTSVGRKRASDLAAGRAVSADTLQRMASYFARHEVDKQGKGWSPDQEDYPSAGRVAWAAWGGDPGRAWAEDKLKGLKKSEPDAGSVHVDVPLGTDRKKKKPMQENLYKSDLKIGSFVRWDSSGGPAQGKVERIATDGKINVPDSSFTVTGTPEDPAALIQIYERTPDGWAPTSQRVGHKASTLSVIHPLTKAIPAVFAKAEERRYTLGPWYVPEAYDAHGEWIGPDDLQQGLWDYVRSGDRDIRLQHDTEVVAGEWVEALTWPYPVEVPMLDAETNEVSMQEFPAGTVFMGVIWEPFAWDLVKAGKIRGYSMGGQGKRVAVDLPMEDGL